MDLTINNKSFIGFLLSLYVYNYMLFYKSQSGRRWGQRSGSTIVHQYRLSSLQQFEASRPCFRAWTQFSGCSRTVTSFNLGGLYRATTTINISGSSKYIIIGKALCIEGNEDHSGHQHSDVTSNAWLFCPS